MARITLVAERPVRGDGGIRWFAYELISNKDNRLAQFTKASDMWAFGMVVLVQYSY